MNKYTTQARCEAGFSLLEVLVALAIFAVTYGVVMQVFGGAARNVGESAMYRRALVMAESQLAAVRADDQQIVWDIDKQVDEKFRIQVTQVPFESMPFDDTSGHLLLAQVTVSVTWLENQQQPRSLSITTLKLGSGRPRS